MSLSAVDARAIALSARQLGVDPRSLGGLMELESNVDPNVWGGAGEKYRGLIQFGKEARREVGLPDGPMTIAQQMPYVNEYFRQRGFKPGTHGVTELYRTVLVGNPGQSGTDSFGTNSDKAAKRMMPGGDLYNRFATRFDPAIGASGGEPVNASMGQASGQPGFSKAAPAQTSEVNPLQAFTNDLIARMNGGGAASSGPLGGEQLAAFAAPEPRSIDRVRGDLINQIAKGGFASEGFAGGSFGIPSALETPGSSPQPQRRMAGEQLGVQPPDMMKSLLPGLLAGIFGSKKQAAPVATAATAPVAQGGKGAGQGAAGGSWGQSPAVAAFHPETGDGYTVPGARDANGRPVVFGRSAANAFAAMMRDSKGLVKPSDITSAQRSESKNAAVGGAVGSMHLGGNAMDIHGASHDWIEKNGARYGWHLHRYGGAGDHGGHFEFRG